MRGLLVVFLVLLAMPAWATVYTVKQGGGGDYTTIQGCAAVAVAGDTCDIYNGTYNERVTPTNDGTAGSRITYKAATGQAPLVRGITLSGDDYITIGPGLTFTNAGMGADSIASIRTDTSVAPIITGNTFQDTTAQCIRISYLSATTSGAQVTNNTLNGCGSATNRAVGIVINSDGALVEGNVISHAEDAIRPVGNQMVIRNNVLFDLLQSENGTDHMDCIQSFDALGTPAADFSDSLIEGNVCHDNGHLDGPNSHFMVVQDVSGAGAEHIIVRYNTIYNVGSYLIVHGDPASGTTAAPYLRFYHNSMNNLSTAASPKPLTTIQADTVAANDNYRNNIFADAVRCSGSPGVFTASSGLVDDYNVGFCASGGIVWGNPFNAEANKFEDVDPLFTSATNLVLQASSTLIDAAGPLTTVAVADTGSGTSLVLTDARMFQPGWAGTTGDQIAVGTVSNLTTVTATDYATNTLTISPAISRSDGESVWLYAKSDGERVLYGTAPDVGAIEFVPQPPGGGTSTFGMVLLMEAN